MSPLPYWIPGTHQNQLFVIFKIYRVFYFSITTESDINLIACKSQIGSYENWIELYLENIRFRKQKLPVKGFDQTLLYT